MTGYMGGRGSPTPVVGTANRPAPHPRGGVLLNASLFWTQPRSLGPVACGVDWDGQPNGGMA